MADASISALTAAAALIGTETVPIAQGTSTVRTTTQDIADLGLSALNVVSDRLSNLISLHDVLSNRVSANSATGGTGSVTSTDLSAAVGVSVLATGLVSVKGLQSVVNTLSDRISGAYDHATSADTHANDASAAATSVDARVNTLSQALSAVSALSVGGVAANGLQSAINALSNRISALNVGAGSVTSTDLSAAVKVSAKSAATSVQGLQSVVDQLSDHVSIVSNAASAADAHASVASLAATSADGHAATASAAATSADGHANTVSAAVETLSAKVVSVSAQIVSVDAHANAASAAATSVDGRVNTVSSLVSALRAVSAKSAATSVQGLQSIIDQLSNRMSGITGGTGSVTSTELSAAVGVSCRAFSASGSATTSVKGLQSVINRLSNTFSNAFSAGSILSIAHTSVANQINNVSCVSAGGTAIGLQSVVNALSARIAVSVTSAEYASTVSIANNAASAVSLVSCVSAAGTAVGLQSVVNALSAAAQTASAAATSIDARVTSVNNNFTSGLGTNVAIGKNGNAQVITGTSFGAVSGLVVPMAANGIYQIDGRVYFTMSILTGTSFGFSYNTTGNGQILQGCMGMRCVTSIIAAGISNMVSTNWSVGNIAEAQMSNAATANISILGGASTRTHALEIEGMLQNGNSAVNLQLQAKHSAAGGGINILPGSYVRAFRVG